jgi:copper resistance protein B
MTLLAAGMVIARQGRTQSMPGMDMPAATVSPSASPRKPMVKTRSKSGSEKDAAVHDMPGMSAPAIAPQPPSTVKQTSILPNDHVAPPPPAHTVPPMSATQMTDMMRMDDRATRGMWLVDRFERTRSSDGNLATAWETDAWWGGDIDKLWWRSEGERGGDGVREVRSELLWNHAFSTFWDWRLGLRDDTGGGPARRWIAWGVRGVAPYWLDLDAALYVGAQGRTAMRLEAGYDLRFTRRLVLSPDLELNVYSRDDPRRGIRAGLSDGDLGLRLRYEVGRRFAPYAGVSWAWRRDRALPPAEPGQQVPRCDRTWLLGVRWWL